MAKVADQVLLPRLATKVAFITGGAQGIGEKTARLFVKHGAKVVIADIQDDKGQSVCEDIGLDKATFIHYDVTIESDVENAINMTLSMYGKLDIMINNAAIVYDLKPNILDNDLPTFERVKEVNVTGVFLGTKHAARAMIPARSGKHHHVRKCVWVHWRDHFSFLFDFKICNRGAR